MCGLYARVRFKCVCFFNLNRMTALAFSFSFRSHTRLHTYIHTKSQEGGYNAVLPPPSSEDVFFSFSLSPRLPGRGTPPFVSKCTLSLSFPLLFSLFLIHGAQRARERAREKSFTWTRNDTVRTRLQKCQEIERGDEEKKKKREMAPCFVLFSPCCGLLENGRRMYGWRERQFSLRPCHGKHTHALWDSFIPWYTAHAHKHVHVYTLCLLSVLSHTHIYTHTLS